MLNQKLLNAVISSSIFIIISGCETTQTTTAGYGLSSNTGSSYPVLTKTNSSCSFSSNDNIHVILEFQNGQLINTSFQDNNYKSLPSWSIKYAGKEGNGLRYEPVGLINNYYWLANVPSGSYQSGTYKFYGKKYCNNLSLPKHLKINLFVENRTVRNNEIEYPEASSVWGFEYKKSESWKDSSGVHGVIRSTRGNGRWIFTFPNYNGSVQLTAELAK